MSTKLDVRPDAFYVAAQSIASDVVGRAGTALDVAGSALAGCGSMAGGDPGGLAWAAEYDRAVPVVLTAAQNLVNGAYRMVGLLERTGLNHERAEAASMPGGASTAPREWLHDAGWTFRAPAPPSAAGGSGDTPTGWGLVSHLIGYVWPGGHQDRLHAAARTWSRCADGILAAADGLLDPWSLVSGQVAPEVDDAITTFRALHVHLRDLSLAVRSLGDACDALAHHVDVVRSAVERELSDLIRDSGMTQFIGGLAAVVTLGGAEVPTQAVQAARIAAAALRIGALIEKFVAAARTVAVTIPTIEEIAAALSLTMERLLGARLAYAGVSIAPRLPTMVEARELALEMRAEEGLAKGATFTDRQFAKMADILRRCRSSDGFFYAGSATREEADAAGRAWVGEDAHLSRSGNAWISQDGLKQYRPPMMKQKRGVVQANFERRPDRSSDWIHNGHVTIREP
ncbi:MAG TPA: hypothetical protein VGN18_02470 [Jatrophihabitans sp.]|uniref:hypothetical protein n=1 Tax=Jatrophihabitans sp. TaxID=1932789 RepID=UPI002E018625|nr:hypothetical protein [Jatrophihabitans sp.]